MNARKLQHSRRRINENARQDKNRENLDWQSITRILENEEIIISRWYFLKKIVKQRENKFDWSRIQHSDKKWSLEKIVATRSTVKKQDWLDKIIFSIYVISCLSSDRINLFTTILRRIRVKFESRLLSTFEDLSK